jgi:hypothetical protein
MSARCKLKREQSLDQRVKEAILQEEMSWSKDEKLEESPKLKFVIAFEGLDNKMNVVEDRHEFEWRPRPSTAAKWMDLEQKIVMADIKQSDEDIKIDDILAKNLPEIPWRYSRNALEDLGLLESEIDLVSRAWIEVVPGVLDFVIVDRTLAVDSMAFVWELNSEGCNREERGFRNRFYQASKSSSSSERRFKHMEKLKLKLSYDECLKLGKEARRDKRWKKADNEAKRYDDVISVHSKEFFNHNLAKAFMEDAPAIIACRDARVLERHIEDLSF